MKLEEREINMAKEKCLVCAYTFKGNEDTTKEGNLICPYCGTIKQSFQSSEDFARKNLIIEGYNYLRESKMPEASKSFTDYIAQYGSDDEELVLGQALLECSLSNCKGSELGKLITVVHENSLKDIIKRESFTNVIRLKNPTIYQNVLDLVDKEKEDNIKTNAVILLSSNLGKLDLYEGMLEDYLNVCRVDFQGEDIESLIYPNIKDSKALVVYVDKASLLKNEYFLSIYYRMKAHKKNVVLIHDGIKIEKMYASDVEINSSDPSLKEKLLQGINRAHGEDINSKDLGYIMESTEVKAITGNIIALPTNAQSILSRAAYKSGISKLIVSSTGEFQIKERAFAESSIEALDIQSKNCYLKIEKDAFSDCHALKSIVFSNDKIILGNSAFRNCTSLRSINLSKFNRLIIPDHCFDGCKSLYQVELMDVSKISKYAFRGTAIEEITITTATSLDSQCFSDCEALNHVKVYENNTENLDIDIDSFNEGTLIEFIGKGTKKTFKATKKKTKKTYKLVFKKSE